MTAPADEIVVTGAGGWLGRNLVEALAHERAVVRVLVQTEDDAAVLALAGRSVQPVVGDVRHPAALDELFDGDRRPAPPSCTPRP